MRTPRVYLETTLFNYYFDKDRDAHADTVKLFNEIKAGKYKAFTSGAVIEELEEAPEEKYTAMFALIERYDISVLSISEDIDKLAEIYVTEGIIPQRFRTDGIHIAVAAVNNLDIIISLNFRHIVKKKTIDGTGKINEEQGYKRVEIFSPIMLIEEE